jgi:glycosyltransferase involved in cell wall biosynthesis
MGQDGILGRGSTPSHGEVPDVGGCSNILSFRSPFQLSTFDFRLYSLPMQNRPKIAFIHRYGLEGWVCCGGHAIPHVATALSKTAEIHFFGPRTTEQKNSELRAQVALHQLPYTYNRANPHDKITKTILWYLWLPWIGLRCRFLGVRLVWNDETIPLAVLILRLFYGKNIAITVMDFFMRIYTQNHPWLHWLRDLIEWIDLQGWKKSPLIFTKVLYTQEFLAAKGVPKQVMHLYRNPVNHTKFHPIDTATRIDTRAQYGYTDDHIVMTHHGILHPNKGNDWILQRLAELKDELPQLRFLLIGDGPEKTALETLTGELDLEDRVTFTGWLPSEEALTNALASADIGLVMRIGQETDHFHMTDTLAHEMACGKAILAVDLKGITEVLAGSEAALLFPTDDAATFRMCAREFTQSVAIRRTAGLAAQQLSRKTGTTPQTACQIANILKDVVSK